MSGDDDERDTGELSQESYDAVTTLLLQRIAANGDPGMYGRVMAELSDADRAEVEAAEQRHAARRRALGEPGW